MTAPDPARNDTYNWCQSHWASALMAGNPVPIFISYSRKDKELMQKLEGHLRPLMRNGEVSRWYDGCIEAGQERNIAKCSAIAGSVGENDGQAVHNVRPSIRVTGAKQGLEE